MTFIHKSLYAGGRSNYFVGRDAAYKNTLTSKLYDDVMDKFDSGTRGPGLII